MSFWKTIKKRISGILNKIIPIRFKRLVILSTLYQHAAEQKLFENIDIDAFNKRMRVAKSKPAIDSAMVLKDSIWGDLNIQTMVHSYCKECDSINGDFVKLNNVTQDLIKMIPEWLRYDRAKMSKDILDLLCSEKINLA